MRRHIFLFWNKIKWWRAGQVQLPGISDMVRTSLVYLGVAALLLVLASSLVMHHVWRDYQGSRENYVRATMLKKQQEHMPGKEEGLSTAVTAGQQASVVQETKQPPQEPVKKVAVPDKDKPQKSALVEGKQEQMVKPLSGKIIGVYGWREDPVYKDWRFFSGVDIQAAKNSEVYAVKSGRVAGVSKSDSGFTVKIAHTDGTVTIYGQLADSYFSAGQSVEQGQVLGRLHMEGKSSLHFEIWQDDRSINPSKIFE